MTVQPRPARLLGATVRGRGPGPAKFVLRPSAAPKFTPGARGGGERSGTFLPAPAGVRLLPLPPGAPSSTQGSPGCAGRGWGEKCGGEVHGSPAWSPETAGPWTLALGRESRGRCPCWGSPHPREPTRPPGVGEAGLPASCPGFVDTGRPLVAVGGMAHPSLSPEGDTGIYGEVGVPSPSLSDRGGGRGGAVLAGCSGLRPPVRRRAPL